MRRAVAAGLQVGATRLTGRFIAGDPPSGGDLAALRAAAADVVAAAPAFRPAEVVLVGGPASNLLKVIQDAPEARRLGSGDLDTAFRLVATEPSEEIAARHGLRPARARAGSPAVER